MIRRVFLAFTGACVIGLVGMVGLKLGPELESRIAPARVNNLNLDPTRFADRVCWTWSSDKLRLLYSDDVDIHLDVLDADGRVKITYVPPLTNVETGLPWQSGMPVGIGHRDIPYCVEVPRAVKGSDRIRIRFTPILHGWLNLWPLPIWTPDIVDPPWVKAPLKRLDPHPSRSARCSLPIGTSPRWPERVSGAILRY